MAIFYLIFLVASFSTPIFNTIDSEAAKQTTESGDNSKIVTLPTFEDYPVTKIYTGKAAPLNLKSHRLAKQFRTRIREALKSGVNFAGHYTIAQWGAGTECSWGAIIDTRTGNVMGALPVSCVGFDYKVGSKLLIMNSPETVELAYGVEIPDYVETEYYKWEHNKLIFLHKTTYHDELFCD